MRWTSAASTLPALAPAVADAAGQLRAALGGARPDLIVAFVSPHHASAWEQLPTLVHAALEPARLLGCSAGAVIGGGREIEDEPGLSLTAAQLPGVDIQGFHLSELLPPPVEPRPGQCFVLLPDPYTFPLDDLLPLVDRSFPDAVTLGGLASGGQQPGGNALYLDHQVRRRGLVGLALSGNLVVDTIVAQGCRPIGEPMFVTRSSGNLIYELDGHRAAVVLQDLYARSSQRDQALFRSSLFVGLTMHEGGQEYRRGDFLVRNVIGLDADTGAVAIGETVPEKRVVQFHLRDAATSAEDLYALLAEHASSGRPAPSGALLFSCLGRGQTLYGEPNHDSDALTQRLGNVPIGGFFCNGEIGPVRGTTFLHGYTSAFGLFSPRT
jgi:small ligand-binding sensory domain FIST